MAKYFVDCVEEVGGCPSLLRTDCGTENVVIAGVQSFLRAECDDDLAGEKAHRYGPSTGNQWIEAWWSYYCRSCLTWWITFFKDLMDRGVFLPGNTLHQECLWFCFAELIQQDLDFVKIHWNTHYIGQSIIIIIIITLFKCQCIFSTAVLIGDTVNKETNIVNEQKLVKNPNW